MFGIINEYLNLYDVVHSKLITMKRLLVLLAMLCLGKMTYAQRANLEAQRQTQAEYDRDHHVEPNGLRVDVTRDKNGDIVTVRESWVSSNGDRNVLTKDARSGRVTSEVTKPDGSKEENGMKEGNSGNSDGGNRGGGNDNRGSEGGGNSNGGNREPSSERGNDSTNRGENRNIGGKN